MTTTGAATAHASHGRYGERRKQKLRASSYDRLRLRLDRASRVRPAHRRTYVRTAARRARMREAARTPAAASSGWSVRAIAAELAVSRSRRRERLGPRDSRASAASAAARATGPPMIEHRPPRAEYSTRAGVVPVPSHARARPPSRASRSSRPWACRVERVDLLALVADVGYQDLVVGRVEGEAPRVAQAVREDLGTAAVRRRQRVVARNPVLGVPPRPRSMRVSFALADTRRARVRVHVAAKTAERRRLINGRSEATRGRKAIVVVRDRCANCPRRRAAARGRIDAGSTRSGPSRSVQRRNRTSGPPPRAGCATER